MDQYYSLSETGSLILGSALLISDQSNETGYVCLDPELRYFENDENWFEPDMDLDEEDNNSSFKISDTVQANVTGNIKQWLSAILFELIIKVLGDKMINIKQVLKDEESILWDVIDEEGHPA